MNLLVLYVCEPERSGAVAGDNSPYQARTDHGGARKRYRAEQAID